LRAWLKRAPGTPPERTGGFCIETPFGKKYRVKAGDNPDAFPYIYSSSKKSGLIEQKGKKLKVF
jgi:hypothetical protein